MKENAQNSMIRTVMGVFACLAVILFSGHALQTILTIKDYILFASAAVSILVIVTGKSFSKLDLPKCALILFVCMTVFTYLVSMGRGYWFYLVFISMALVAYAIVEHFSFEKAVNVYLVLMTITAVIGLVGYILWQSTPLLNNLPLMKNANGVEYRVGVIYNYIVHEVDRNCGMFWEPGLFATHLTIAMVLEMLRPHRTSILRLVLFSVCIFTSNSSAGFVLWFLCILLLLVKGQNKQLGPLAGLIGLILLGMAIVFILNFDAFLQETGLQYNEYFQKLSSSEVERSSRVNAFEHNWEMFLRGPLFGVGFADASAQMTGVANTSTSTFLLSVFGLPGLLYTAFIVYGIFKLQRVNLFSKVVVSIIALVIINKEPHDQILWTWCLLFYLLKQASLQARFKAIPESERSIESESETLAER